MARICYSAQIEADHRKYVKRYGADILPALFAALNALTLV